MFTIIKAENTVPKDKTQSHKLIMRIAKEEFLSQGYEKTSMREVAGKA